MTRFFFFTGVMMMMVMGVRIWAGIVAAAVVWAWGCGGARAQGGLTTVALEMQVAVGLEFGAPEGFYEFDGKTLSWSEPAEGLSHYMRVTVRDMASSQPVVGAKAVAMVMTGRGKAVGTSVTLHGTWDAEAPHYGANVAIPDEVTSGNVAVRIEPPKGRRLGRDVGDFFTKPVTVAFTGVDFAGVKPVVRADEDVATSGPGRVEWPEGRRPYVEPTPYPGAAPAGAPLAGEKVRR